MTDRTFTATELHELLSGEGTAADKVHALHELILFPPTLADMTEEERDACEWMQCDVGDGETRPVIVNPNWEDGSARVLWPGAFIEEIEWEGVTPRPDLPRMEWPGDKKPAPALPDGWRLADHLDYGRVIVTNTTPDPSGHVYFVGLADDSTGCDRFFCDPARLTYLDQEADQ